ncbi:MAG: transglutaminase-like cysteine peptidase [Pseudolabrys sp.]|jgi:predicted transglutaminase-like cysteine proteinase
MRFYHLALTLSLVLSGLNAQAASPEDSDEPFGLATREAQQGPLWVTWRHLQAELQSDSRTVAQCRAEPLSCTEAAQRFMAIVKQGAGFDGAGHIGRINRAVNLAIRPVTGTADQPGWTSPLASLKAGRGNCKQFAVLKYAALLDAGIAPNDLRLVIVSVKQLQKPASHAASHLVVAVRVQAHWLILDNRTLVISDSRTLLDRLEPLFTLDNRGVRQFVSVPDPSIAVGQCGDALG